MEDQVEKRLRTLLSVVETRELTPEERSELDELKAGLSDVNERLGALEAEAGEIADDLSISADAAAAAEVAEEMADVRSVTPVEAPKPVPQSTRMVKPGAPKFVKDLNDNAAMARRDLALRGWFLQPAGLATDGMVKAARDIGFDLTKRMQPITLSAKPMTLRGTNPQATTPGAAGGFLVPTELMASAFEKHMLYTANLRNYCKVLRTNGGNEIDIPTVDDTAVKGSIVAENAVKPVSDVTFSQVQLKAYKYTSGIVLVSMELLQDSAISIPELLGELLAARIARIQADHFALGTGTGQPQGYAVGAGDGGTTTATGAISVDDLLALRNKVDLAYRQNGSFVMSDSTLAAVQKLRFATTGEPVFVTDYRDPMAPVRLFGHPIVIDNSLPAVTTAGGVAAVFGDLSKYIIRDAMGLTLKRSDERYFEFNQSAFLAEMRTDAKVVNNKAIMAMKWK
jgi:HK97 family phage major capsid protein